MASWTRVQTLKLLEVLQDYPNLFQICHADYKNRVKKSQSLNEIAEKTKCCRPETSVKDVILKLRTLKTQYLKEKNNIIRSKRSGVGANEVYVPILWCYDRLNFWDNTGDEVVGESNISFLSEHFDPTSSEIIAEPEVHSLPKTSRSLHTTVPVG
ncbi:uncharacterized protein LOC129948991 [Eupeodes corollae]|uniref:uncharacterized protein LOC129946356 n=1 Tax=Eupeodes corollae TaxID=290404 RepID=UPI0024918D8A|nr:uncharacterized protein LOC129946356 [Eupeodes corollae]XP_055916138.1 uncharacterized protein LOC129948991 [Eupeodes corollae]